MMAGSHDPSGAFTIYRPPWEGFFKPPAMRVVADFKRTYTMDYGLLGLILIILLIAVLAENVYVGGVGGLILLIILVLLLLGRL
jgi:hypothetical protein